jgi:ribonuclease HI
VICLKFIRKRWDHAHAVNVVSKYNRNPGQAHWMAVKRIFRYLKGTINQPLVFIAKDTLLNGQLNVSVFSDADWAGDVDDRRSTSGYVVRIGQSTVMWSTKKQKTVSLSSAEAEYMALSTAVQEVMWLRRFLCEMLDVSGMSVRVCMSVFVDNQAALHISKNDVYHDRTKHIDIRYHFVREAVKDGLFQLLWVPTHQQLADGLTKALGTVLFAKLTSSVMNCP